ncbi:MAG: DUF3017 domain-containing protein [Streptosporangiaceae bacterium]
MPGGAGTSGGAGDSPQSPGGAGEQVQPPPARRGFRETPLVVVLSCVAFGLVVVGLDHFKRGSVVVAVAVLLAAVLRGVLPERTAGLLAVRGRAIDVLVLALLGLALAADAIVVPPPS